MGNKTSFCRGPHPVKLGTLALLLPGSSNHNHEGPFDYNHHKRAIYHDDDRAAQHHHDDDRAAQPHPDETEPPATTPTSTVGTLRRPQRQELRRQGRRRERRPYRPAERRQRGAAAGTTVYFPAGTYFMSQSSVFLNIPSNVTLQGEGDASVLVFQDDGQDKRSNGLQIVGQSNVAIRDLKLMGTQTNKRASVQLIRADGTSGLTLSNVTFDGGEYALRTTSSGSSSRASDITVTNCRTLTNVLNPFFFAYARNIRVSGCTLEANRVDCVPGRCPHHFYVTTTWTASTSRTALYLAGSMCLSMPTPMAVPRLPTSTSATSCSLTCSRASMGME